MSKHRSGGGSRGGFSIEGIMIGLVMFLALVIGVYAILPTFFDSTNSTAVAALNAPTGAQGFFTALPIIAAIIIGITILVAAFSLMKTRRA